ncbi:uncharacterized protein F4822DRAFT_302499 [Hypoxylon trugodes]|uniref:uncharacterized protein n=1 Tax=Hypoxylon trugodes TaxID=326681 RepID=UPI0021A09DE5|nr:uncharacterized protein F4822DRAFT_302499 [Hypoxylon trugodes]KAI1388108.1 hypothetical protein F4822DRAFT_302499 [Hypoxylon trugodes]
MAAHKGQPKPGKAASGHAKKQSSVAAASTRPVVVPAIPLPMMPKQQNKHVPTTPSNGFPASSLEAALALHNDHADHTPAPVTTRAQHSAKPLANEVNGTNVEKPENTTKTVNGAHHADSNSNGNSNGTEKIDTPLASTNGVNGTSSGPQQLSSTSSVVDTEFAFESRSGSASATNGTNQELIGANYAVQNVSQPQSATSPLDQLPPFYYPPPPPTHPLQHQLSTDQISTHANLRGPPHMHHYQHHPHMSNGTGAAGAGPGGVVFGGFAGSHTPSPVPPPGGFMPPPPPVPVNGENTIHPRPNGHHHASSGTNGFPGPITTRFGPDMMPASTVDSFGPASASVPPNHFDPFSPGFGRFGLSTPHSFPGSHTSGEPNGVENGAMPHPPNGMPYGGHGYHEHPVGHPPPAANFPPFLPPPEAFTHQPNFFDDGIRESIMYFRDQFDSGELTDCILELVSTKCLHHPVKITGHKLVLARSSALKHHIMAARANDSGSHTITIESDDQYLRSDAWWHAVRRLYMFPLLDPPMLNNPATGLHFANDKVDRFQFCLGYAAAGHLLNMHDVFIRGLQMAAEFINWDTLEESLGFIFEGTSQRHLTFDNQDVDLDFMYGPEVRFLLNVTMNFLINAFPSDFELDPFVPDPVKFARIPTATNMVSSPTSSTAHPIARGTNTRSQAKSNRLTNIKFGDLPATLPEDGNGPPRGPAHCSPVLSRILLNLPFNELCAVLTSESHGISGWNTAQDRYHAVANVVAERESRRLRMVDAIRAGTVPGSPKIQQRLSAQRRHACVEPWDVLNWQEEVVQPRGAEVPRIIRRWVPQFLVASEVPQQLQPQLYDPRNSIV